MVIHEGQPVPEGFEPLQHHFLIRCELINTARFNRFHEFGEVIVEFVEDPIQPAALVRACCAPRVPYTYSIRICVR